MKLSAAVLEAAKKSMHQVLDPHLKGQGRKSSLESAEKAGDEEQPSITRYLLGATNGYWNSAEKEEALWQEAKKYSSDVGAEGGILIHPKIADQIIPMIREKVLIRSLGPQEVTLDATNTLDMPRQTQATEAVWVGEDEDIEAATAGGAQMKWGALSLKLKTVVGFAEVPNNLIEDSLPAADTLIKNDISTTLAIAEETAWLRGPGGKSPLGLYFWPGLPQIDLKAAVLTADNLIDAQTAVEDNGGRVDTWLMSPLLKGFIRKLKDGQGNYLWQRGDVSKKEPDSLLGMPCRYSRLIPNNLTYLAQPNTTFVVLANWKDFLITQKRAGITMDVSKEAGDSFKKDQTWFKAKRRIDGGPRVPESFYILKGVRRA